MMLVEEGFNVVSTDASDKMLKYALKERWSRRKDPAFDRWSMYQRTNSTVQQIVVEAKLPVLFVHCYRPGHQVSHQ